MFKTRMEIADCDSGLFAAMKAGHKHRKEHIELIASANCTGPAPAGDAGLGAARQMAGIAARAGIFPVVDMAHAPGPAAAGECPGPAPPGGGVASITPSPTVAGLRRLMKSTRTTANMNCRHHSPTRWRRCDCRKRAETECGPKTCSTMAAPNCWSRVRQ